MTETEIMKALECCSKDEINGLNIFTYGDVPMRSLLKYALALLNRKDAKIGKLNFENLQMIASIKGLEERARAEAIKEFAERLKKEIACFVPNVADVREVIDNTAKEMGVEL